MGSRPQDTQRQKLFREKVGCRLITSCETKSCLCGYFKVRKMTGNYCRWGNRRRESFLFDVIKKHDPKIKNVVKNLEANGAHQ